MDGMITALQIIDGFSQSLGLEGAKKLLAEVTTEAGFPNKAVLTKEEAMKVCTLLKAKQGLTKILGMTLATQITTSNMSK